MTLTPTRGKTRHRIALPGARSSPRAPALLRRELIRRRGNVSNVRKTRAVSTTTELSPRACPTCAEDLPCPDWPHQPSQDASNPVIKRLGMFVVPTDPDERTTNNCTGRRFFLSTILVLCSLSPTWSVGRRNVSFRQTTALEDLSF